MADKTKHSNDEIFELLSAMAVDIEELKKGSTKETSKTDDDENTIMRLEKEVMWQRKYVESFPKFMRKYFQDWQAYQERKDDEWYDLMEDFAKQVNENDAKHLHNNEIFKNAYLSLKEYLCPKEPSTNNLNENLIKRNFEPLIIPKSFKGWLKFLFYDCPRYSFSKPNRRKFLSDLGRIFRLLISIIVIVLLFLLANENGYLRKNNQILYQYYQELQLHPKD